MRSVLFTILAFILISLVFWMGLDGGFHLDDGGNLVNNQAVQLEFGDEDFVSRAWSASPNDDGRRPLAMLLFATEHALFGGFDAASMKAVNLGIHLINTLLLALLMTRLVHVLKEPVQLPAQDKQDSLFLWALLAAAIWAVLPGNIGNVLYVVQRMNLLASLFMLLGLLVYFSCRSRADTLRSVALLFALTLPLFYLGYLCKENALLGPVFILGYELVSWNRCRTGRSRVLSNSILLLLVVAGFLGLILLGDLHYSEAYARRPFDWTQRLALQPLALFYYLAGDFLPYLAMPRFYLDFFATAEVLEMGVAAWLSLVAVLGVIVFTCWKVIWRGSLIIYFCLGWFFLFHLLESTVLPLEIAFQHRNYLPSMGLVLGALLLGYTRAIPVDLRKPLTGMAALYLVMLGSAAALESLRWGDDYTLLTAEAEQSPPSPRAHYEAGLWLYQNDPADLFCEDAREHFELSEGTDLTSIGGFFGLALISERCGGELPAEVLAKTTIFLESGPPATSSIRYLDLLAENCPESRVAGCSLLDQLAARALNNPNNTQDQRAGLFFLRSKLAWYQGQSQQALTLAQRVLDIDPSYTNAHIMMLNIMHTDYGCEALRNALDTLDGTRVIQAIERDVGSLEARYQSCY